MKSKEEIYSLSGTKKNNVNGLLVPTFLVNFYFDLYFFILPFLIPKLKNEFYFGPYCHLTNENCTWSTPLAQLMLTWPFKLY